MPKPLPREVNNPRPGLFKIRLVRGGPWVGAAIVHDGFWLAVVNGTQVSAPCVDPTTCHEIMKIWSFGRDITKDEYRALTRPGRDVQPMQPVNLIDKGSIF
jgi:hypothetical protein